MLPDNTILLSIQPRFAEKIFERTKAVELRRVRPKVDRGDIALVYVSSPVKALYGAFSIEKVITDTPSKLWQIVKDIAGVSRAEFDHYYRGASVGVGIFIKLSSVKTLNNPMDLDRLRRDWPHFQPPQSYRYLRSILEEYDRCPSRLQSLMAQYCY